MLYLRIALAVFTLATISVAQEFASKAEEYLNAQFKRGHFMGSVLVARDGKILFEKSYGLANAEWNIPNTPQTKFRLGSITKQFTATAILQLAEQGKLAVTDPVSKYYTDAPESWSKVTIHHLLTHTSGIPSYTEERDFFPKKSRDPRTPAEIIKLTQDQPLQFEPGAQWKYDNTGYILLGYIIEKASGMKYADYLKKYIFEPLGMNDSGYDLAGPVIARRASGYGGDKDHLVNTAYLDMTLPYAAGSLYSTVEDLLKWDQALYAEKVLKRESIAKMYTPLLNHYAYGWDVGDQDKHKRVSHGGGINGFNTYIARYPEDRTFAVVLCNLNSPLPDRVASDLAKLSWGEPVKMPTEPKNLKLETSVLDRYVGKYKDEGEGGPVFEFSRDGDRLRGGPAGQGKIPLSAESETEFRADALNAEFSFQRDSQGVVTGMLFRQGSSEHKFKRVAEPAAGTVR